MAEHKVHVWRTAERTVLEHWSRTQRIYCERCGTQRYVQWLSRDEAEERQVEARDRRERIGFRS